VGCGVLFVAKGEIWIQPTPFGKATGFLISVLTGLLLLLLSLQGLRPGLRDAIDHGLTILFAATLVHVLVIGWTNFRRPTAGGTAVYRRGWGLLVGRAASPRSGKDDRADRP